MRKCVRSLVVPILILMCFVVSAGIGKAETIEGVTLTDADVKQLLTAMHTALKPNDNTIPITVQLKPAGQMPAYAPDWYYAGITTSSAGVKTLNVWTNAALEGTALQNALEASFLLALCDGGYGGTNFKQLYDVEAAKDAQLPAGSPNPFLNRQKMGVALTHLIP
jgi:hypothetical protein